MCAYKLSEISKLLQIFITFPPTDAVFNCKYPTLLIYTYIYIYTHTHTYTQFLKSFFMWFLWLVKIVFILSCLVGLNIQWLIPNICGSLVRIMLCVGLWMYVRKPPPLYCQQSRVFQKKLFFKIRNSL